VGTSPNGTRPTVFGAAVISSGYRGTFTVTVRLAACRRTRAAETLMFFFWTTAQEEAPPLAIGLTPGHRLDLAPPATSTALARRRVEPAIGGSPQCGTGRFTSLTGARRGSSASIRPVLPNGVMRERPLAPDHFPSWSTTASHNAMVSALLARSDGFWRTAVCTITSFEAGSTRIICPRTPSRANFRCSPGNSHT
jgi:hypothetical protein